MNLEISNQSYQLAFEIKVGLYRKLNETYTEGGSFSKFCIHTSGLGVGIAEVVLDAFAGLGNFFEKLAKGTVNIVGSPFSENCSFIRGAKQLAGIPFQLVSDIQTVATKTILDIPGNTIGMLVAPKEYTQICQSFHKSKLNMLKEYPGDFLSRDYSGGLVA